MIDQTLSTRINSRRTGLDNIVDKNLGLVCLEDTDFHIAPASNIGACKRYPVDKLILVNMSTEIPEVSVGENIDQYG